MTENREILSMMCEDKPIWKDIEGYDGAYQVNQYGAVRIPQKDVVLTHKDNGIGYKYIQLYKKNTRTKFYVHRLVASYFVDNPHNYSLVDHIDSKPANNQANNLRWVNKSLNAQNSRRPRNNSTGFKGVARCQDKGVDYFEASITVNSKRLRRNFKSLEEAVAYRRQMVELHYSSEHYIEDR